MRLRIINDCSIKFEPVRTKTRPLSSLLRISYKRLIFQLSDVEKYMCKISMKNYETVA